MPSWSRAAGSIELSFSISDLELSHWWILVFFGALTALIIYWTWRRRRNHRFWFLWPLPLVLIPLVLMLAAMVNNHFGMYNRVGDLFDSYTFPTGSSSLLRDPEGTHPVGVAIETIIPSNSAGVPDQPAFIWLPPQYFTAPAGTDFPVIYLYHGSPGTYANWFVGGGAIDAALASANAGKPAIIVTPTVLPSPLADSECVNGTQGNWQDYLAKDVPEYIERNAHALVGARAQGTAGLSMGGYCAQITALRNPSKFGASGNFSGSTMPTYSGSMTDLFGASPDLDATVNSYTSTWVVKNRAKSRSVATWSSIGKDDEVALIVDQKSYSELAQSLGMVAPFSLTSGTHTFYVWAADFKEWLPWALNRLEPPHVPTAEEVQEGAD